MKLRLGTRRSRLAVTQARHVKQLLEDTHDGLEVELVEVVTGGDRATGRLAEVGGKGLFTAELERGLATGDLDLAVHSLKDLPVDLPPELELSAVPRRADPRDALVSDIGESIDDLPAGTTVFTGSLRRRAQLLARRPDLVVEPMRGNVDTRLRKWRTADESVLVLAVAGLDRLGVDDAPVHPIEPELMTPAPGQGALAVQTRRHTEAARLCRSITEQASLTATTIERTVVAEFGGDCTLPLGAWARHESGTLRFDTFLGTPDGARSIRTEVEGEPADVAAAAIDQMRRRDAEEIMTEIEAAR